MISSIEEYDAAKKQHKKGDIFETKCCSCRKIINEKFFSRTRKKLQDELLFCRSCAVQKVWDNRKNLDNLKIKPFNDIEFKVEDNILFGKNGLPIREKVLNLKCEICGESFSRTYKNLKNGLKKYNRILCKHCITSIHLKEFNKSLKNKTAEERFGLEQGLLFRKKMSEVTSGENNPRYGTHLSNETKNKIRQSLTGVSLEERYGKEKADDIKHQMSLNFSGENNPMFGKPAPTGSGNGWSGWYNNFYFRSLLELGFLLKNNNVKSAEHIKIPYIDWNKSQRTYHPDFLIDDNIIIEVKPKHLLNAATNKLKFAAAEKWCYENNFKFKVLTEDDIKKPSFEELKQLKQNNKLKFLQRYEEKFNEWSEKYGK